MTKGPKLTRRAALSGVGLSFGACALERTVEAAAAQPAAAQPAAAQGQPARDPFAAIPANGRAGPGLEPFDAGMRAIMNRHGIPGAALAVAKEGKLVFAKGYGWANAATGE